MSLPIFTSQIFYSTVINKASTKPIGHFLSRYLTVLVIADGEKRRLSYYYHPTSVNHSNSQRLVDFEFLQQGLLLRNGYFSNPYFLNKVISFSAKSASMATAAQFHSIIIKLGFILNVYICSAVIDMYAKCGEIHSAQKMFDEMPERNVVTWNSLISGYLNVNCPRFAVGLFVKMLRAIGVVSSYSISACLVACSQLGAQASEFGNQIHGLVTKSGFGRNVVVGTGLIDMYASCGSVGESRLVFDHMVERNVFTWNSMITAYAQSEQPEEAMFLVSSMTCLGVKANYITYNSLLTSFCGPQYLNCCKQVHCCVVRCGLESNAFISVTLVAVYSKCSNNLQDFKKLCSGVKLYNQISWNAVIAGYCNLGSSEDALKCFCEMTQSGVRMDFYTFTSVLGAIGDISGLEEGRQIHALILKLGCASNVCVQNGLVSMYGRCGLIEDSKKVFWLMKERDFVSWNALLTGCARNGYGFEAVELFDQMRKTKIRPQSTTFLAVLSACSHVGLVKKGLQYFGLMASDESIGPLRVEHYACVVDIFGRAGYLSEAETIINNMPVDPGPSVYRALLTACLVHGNKEIALRTGKKLLDLCPDDPATYILLSNVLRSVGCWDDAKDIWRGMCDRGVRKKPACSWI